MAPRPVAYPAQGFWRWAWAKAAEHRVRWPLGLAVALPALTEIFSSTLPNKWPPEVTFLLALGVAAVVIIAVTLAIAAIGFFQARRPREVIVPLGWSAIIDGGNLGPGQHMVFRRTAQGTVIPPPFYVVSMGQGMVSDDRGNTVGSGRVWYRRGSGNTFL